MLMMMIAMMMMMMIAMMMMMSMMMMMMISTNNAFGDYEGDNGRYEGRLICFDGYYVYVLF